MEWIQIVSLFFANAGLILWMRAESRNDWRHLESKCDAQIRAIQEEIKDFHSRLIRIEERSRWENASNAVKICRGETRCSAQDDANVKI